MNNRPFLHMLLLLLLTFNQVQASVNIQDVLVLNSYHSGYIWSDGIMKGITREFNKNHPTAQLYIDFMDTKRNWSQEYNKELYKLLKTKYQNHPFQVIITADDNAFNFVRLHHKSIFHNAPVISCGLSAFDDSSRYTSQRIRGILEKVEIKPTIELIIKNHPKTQKLEFLCDSTPSGLPQQALIRAVMSEFPQLEYRIITNADYTLEELLAFMKKIPDKTIVVNALWLEDKTGERFEYQTIYPQIFNACRVPVYALSYMSIGLGVVGGKVINGEYHGKKAAELAIDILYGKSIMEIPRDLTSDNIYMFDYLALKRHHISTNNLPKNSIVINKPLNVLQRNRKFLWFFMAIIFMESVIIIKLVFDNLLQKRTELISQKSLAEKDVLLKEIHHRVKNNLQLVSSLLYLQSKHVRDENAVKAFQESQDRVKSIALVHEKLYQSKDLARINFNEYINNLAVTLFDAYTKDFKEYKFEHDIPKISLSVDYAVPCGLIINELLTNTIKHAFPARHTGLKHVKLTMSENKGHFTIIVKDNGVGLPENFSFATINSLGLGLVKIIAENQLNGTLETKVDHGTAFIINFTL